MIENIEQVIGKNGLIFAFLFVGVIMLFSFWFSNTFTRKKLPGVAIAVMLGLGLALFGGENGIADISRW